eukprot:SAG11_NODE_440_length_9448_cov_3.356509_3_plen_199_part_00
MTLHEAMAILARHTRFGSASQGHSVALGAPLLPRHIVEALAVSFHNEIRLQWDAGMATPQHTPRGRGFDSSLIYYGHENDYWTRQQGGCLVNATDPEPKRPTFHMPCVDFWSDDAPAIAANASAGDTYEEYLFKAEVSPSFGIASSSSVRNSAVVTESSRRRCVFWTSTRTRQRPNRSFCTTPPTSPTSRTRCLNRTT